MSEIDFSGGNHETPVQDQATGGGEAPAAPQDQGGVIEYNGRQLSQEEVLKKLAHADSHIDTLTAEREADRQRLAALEEAVNKSSKLEDVLQALSKGEEEPAAAAQPAEEPVDLDAKLDALLAKREAAKQAEGNWNTVTSTLGKVYGSKTNEKVAEVAAENDMTLEEAEQFARSKPKAFLKLFGNLESPGSAPLTPGARNPAAFQAPAAAPSGYMDAKTTKDQVSVYQRKLAQYGL